MNQFIHPSTERRERVYLCTATGALIIIIKERHSFRKLLLFLISPYIQYEENHFGFPNNKYMIKRYLYITRTRTYFLVAREGGVHPTPHTLFILYKYFLRMLNKYDADRTFMMFKRKQYYSGVEDLVWCGV